MVAIKNLLIAVAAFAVTVYAAPSWGNSGSSDSTGSTGSSGSTDTPGSTDGSNTASSGQTTLGDAAQQCGSNKNVSCCNSATDDSGIQVSDLLGGNCSPLDLALIGMDSHRLLASLTLRTNICA